MTKKIFLSYSSHDKIFKDHFTDIEVFGGIGPEIEILDYVKHANFGDITRFLEMQINNSAAFIAFISEDYIKSEYSQVEFWSGISEVAKRRLIFVPVLMDASAHEWWKHQKKIGALRDLAPDGGEYAFLNFSDKGRPVVIYDNGRFNAPPAALINDVANGIKTELENLANGNPPGPGGGKPEIVSPPPTVVVLGHPESAFPKNIKQSSDELIQALQGRGQAPTLWGDDWVENGEVREKADDLLRKDTIFVQPLSLREAQISEAQPELTRNSLTKIAGRDQNEDAELPCSIVLWIPSNSSEPRSESATKAPSTRLVRATADVLAAELAPQTVFDAPELPIILLEEYVDVTSLRETLYKGFQKVVSQVIKPTPKDWRYDPSEKSTMLEDQIDAISGDMAIVGFNDLNLDLNITENDYRNKDPFERKRNIVNRSLLIKYSGSVMRIRAAEIRVNQQRERENRRLRPRLKLFWSTIVFEHVRELPHVLSPARRPDELWCLLPFKKGESDGTAAPEPSRTAIFQGYLQHWVQHGGATDL